MRFIAKISAANFGGVKPAIRDCLCKLTEIHVLDFLKKARALMAHAGRKRLTLADIELLKFILE